MADNMISGIGGSVAALLGSDAPPKAILNRFAAPTAKSGGRLSTDLLDDTGRLSKSALDSYMALQPKMEGLANDQEQTLQGLLSRRLSADPSALLKSVGDTAYGFINPNVINPLSQFDVNSDTLMRRARGINPASVDSTSERLRNARIASQRYYDVAKDVNANLPNLFGQAFNQRQTDENAAAGIIPQIQQGWESVAARPTTGLANRINSVNAALDAGGKSIGNINSATQGFQQPQNWADKIGKASNEIGSAMSSDLGRMSQMAGSL